MADFTTVAQCCFWLLLVAVLFLPIRWSVVAYVLLVQFDLSAIDFNSLGSLGRTVGFENSLKVLILPTLLLYRLRPLEQLGWQSKRLRVAWLLLIGYAAVSTLWSPYQLAALKMVGYLYADAVLFVVFVSAWKRGWFDAKTFTFVIWVSLFLGVVQTYLLGNNYGNPEYEFRFTSFTGAQSFGPFLLAMLVLVLFSDSFDLGTLLTCIAGTIGLLMTGGRTMFLGFCYASLVSAVFLAKRRGRKVNLGLLLRASGVGLVLLTTIVLLVQSALPQNRLNELLTASLSQQGTLEDVGTFAWRLVVYQRTLEALAERSPSQLMLGSGTSSGATVTLDSGIFQDDTIDPNRTLHDEFLRSLYEWGLPGLILILFVLEEAIRLAIGVARQSASPGAWAFLAICVPLLISLGFENLLAEAASPASVGYNLVLAWMIVSYV